MIQIMNLKKGRGQTEKRRYSTASGGLALKSLGQVHPPHASFVNDLVRGRVKPRHAAMLGEPRMGEHSNRSAFIIESPYGKKFDRRNTMLLHE